MWADSLSIIAFEVDGMFGTLSTGHWYPIWYIEILILVCHYRYIHLHSRLPQIWYGWALSYRPLSQSRISESLVGLGVRGDDRGLGDYHRVSITLSATNYLQDCSHYPTTNYEIQAAVATSIGE